MVTSCTRGPSRALPPWTMMMTKSGDLQKQIFKEAVLKNYGTQSLTSSNPPIRLEATRADTTRDELETKKSLRSEEQQIQKVEKDLKSTAVKETRLSTETGGGLL